MRKRLRTGINLRFPDHSSAMTDQCFLLIVFFMVAASFVASKGLLVVLPDPSSAPEELTEDKAVVVGIFTDEYTLDGIRVAEADLLAALAAAIGAKTPDAVIVEPAAGVPYGAVLRVLELARDSGAGAFSINTKRSPVPVDIAGTDGAAVVAPGSSGGGVSP